MIFSITYINLSRHHPLKKGSRNKVQEFMYVQSCFISCYCFHIFLGRALSSPWSSYQVLITCSLASSNFNLLPRFHVMQSPSFLKSYAKMFWKLPCSLHKLSDTLFWLAFHQPANHSSSVQNCFFVLFQLLIPSVSAFPGAAACAHQKRATSHNQASLYLQHLI